MITIVIPGTPVAAVRMTQLGKFKPAAKRYLSWLEAAKHYTLGRDIPKEPAAVRVTAYIGIAKTRMWEVKPGDRHLQKPDFDNLVKATVDAVWPENKGGDAGLWNVTIRKYWEVAKDARVVIEIEP